MRYVLEGSVRKASGKVRITGQLIDALTGAHLWADRFDGGLDDIFDLQDKVTASVVGAIAPKLEQAEIERGLAAATGKRVTMTIRIDPSIIAGVVAKVGGVVYDASVATQLRKIKAVMTDAV